MTNIIFDTNAARDFVGGMALDRLEEYVRDNVHLETLKLPKIIMTI